MRGCGGKTLARTTVAAATRGANGDAQDHEFQPQRIKLRIKLQCWMPDGIFSSVAVTAELPPYNRTAAANQTNFCVRVCLFHFPSCSCPPPTPTRGFTAAFDDLINASAHTASEGRTVRTLRPRWGFSHGRHILDASIWEKSPCGVWSEEAPPFGKLRGLDEASGCNIPSGPVRWLHFFTAEWWTAVWD